MQEEVSLEDRVTQKQIPKKYPKKQRFDEKDSHNKTQPGNLRKWLNGNFTCKKCGKEYNTMCFGFGETICPDCYK
jgi:hypothetical protein